MDKTKKKKNVQCKYNSAYFSNGIPVSYSMDDLRNFDGDLVFNSAFEYSQMCLYVNIFTGLKFVLSYF